MSAPAERYPGQFEQYRRNPAKGDEEAILGTSMLNITSFDEFLRLTAPLARNVAQGEAENVAQGEAENVAHDAADAKPRAKRKGRCTKKVFRERTEEMLRWLEDGVSPRRVIEGAMKQYGIKERSAQRYLKMGRDRLANQASKTDHLASLELSKRQHNLLFSKAMQDLKRVEDPTKSASLLRAAALLLKQRDQVQEDIRHHRVVTRRDNSPDSKSAKLKRQDMLALPLAEFIERLENMRNLWYWEFCHHYPQFLERQRVMLQVDGYDPKLFELFMRDADARWQKQRADMERLFGKDSQRVREAEQDPDHGYGDNDPISKALRTLAEEEERRKKASAPGSEPGASAPGGEQTIAD